MQWIPAFAGMTVMSGRKGGELHSRRFYPPEMIMRIRYQHFSPSALLGTALVRFALWTIRLRVVCHGAWVHVRASLVHMVGHPHTSFPRKRESTGKKPVSDGGLCRAVGIHPDSVSSGPTYSRGSRLETTAIPESAIRFCGKTMRLSPSLVADGTRRPSRPRELAAAPRACVAS